MSIKDNINKRGVSLDNNLCVMCGLVDENVSHLFFYM